ncbi:MAG: ATP synthase F1 subunit gamma [bacterium]|nr:ATP synthase F1 subunit gamma [bacterium]
MSMALKELKNRIKAADNIKQITRAMKLIASVKIKKIQRAFLPFKEYFKNLQEIVSVLLSNTDFKLSLKDLDILKQKEGNKIGLVVITSDKGLCGAFNTNIFNYFEKNYINLRDNLVIVAVGKKAVSYFNTRKYNLFATFDKVGDIPSFEFIKKLRDQVFDLYKNVSKVEVIYARYYSASKFIPVSVKLLPFDINLVDIKRDDKVTLDNVDHFIFEPFLEDIGQEIFEIYVSSLIYQLILESKLSEFSARLMAMNTATDNAENLIKDLKLLFFKKRQEAITKELLEIVAGVEALK